MNQFYLLMLLRHREHCHRNFFLAHQNSCERVQYSYVLLGMHHKVFRVYTLNHLCQSHNFIFQFFQVTLVIFFLQNKYIVMMTKDESTKIVIFKTPGAGVLVQGRGHISHRVKMHYSY